MKKLFCIFFILSTLSIYSSNIKLGVDVFLEKEFENYKGKRAGLITNHTGVNSKLQSTIDMLFSMKDIKLIKLFGPEHGLRGVEYAGDKVKNSTDYKTGLPIYSLYGYTRKPNDKMLSDIDILIYDIQDIGTRSYTYISTMLNSMEVAAQNNLEFIVFDRPIPLNGNIIDGNILEKGYESFIGLYPIPYVYGMTAGELAGYINKEFNINAKLTVIKMVGYTHDMDYSDTGLQWIPTSPHIPKYDTSYYYPLTGCIGELGTLSIGVGYTTPFEVIAHEWIDGDKFADELNSKNIPGIFFRPVTIKPFYGGFKDKNISGVHIMITDKKNFYPYQTMIHILEAIQKMYPKYNVLNKKGKAKELDMFEKATGTSKIREMLLQGKKAEEIIAMYQPELQEFKEKRKNYLLYK